MVSPIKRVSEPPSSSQSYTQVPNPSGSPFLDQSPDPSRSSSSHTGSDPYSHLSNANMPESSYLSPESADHAMLSGRRESSTYPAPSIISRDSTFNTLPGTPGNDHRSSWGSGMALAAAADGAEVNGRRPPQTRGTSNLAYSSYPARASHDDAQGHITPASAAAAGMSEKDAVPRWAAADAAEKKKRRRMWLALAGVLTLLAVGLGVGLGIGLTRNRRTTPASNGSSGADNANPGGAQVSGSGSASGSPSASGTAAAPSATPTSGGQGSTILLADGTSMTYDNPHGGTWVWDAANPFNNDAQCNSWTPALSQKWTWGKDKVYGVNLGGWLNTEPFIVPSLYELYPTGPAGQTVDEYTLSRNLGSNLTAVMTEHYETFITERDFAEIASAGLNWIRLPIGFWAVATSDEDPYLERVSWTYVLKAIQWARKYGIRINFDLHAVPGSQNGWNHSGHIGSINWMNGVMGLANAQRALDIIRTLTQFIVQPEYAPVIPMFGFINEPNANGVGQSAVGSFYQEAYKTIREITGFGEGNGPMLSVHDGFIGIRQWFDFLPGADRIALDQHPYMVFGDQPTGGISAIAHTPCQWWAKTTNDTSNQYGVNSAGEWSAAINDCGLWINAVGAGSRWAGTYAGYTGPTGSCDQWNDYRQWDNQTISDLNHFVRASMDALQNYFFWTWKIGNSTGPIAEVNPFWHYRLGLQHGWIPSDPREAIGTCAQDGVTGDDFSGTYASAYMTGGPGAGTVAPVESASYPWPPASFTNVPAASMRLLPQYTQSASPITMPAATFTVPGSTETIAAGNGWANANANTRSAYAPIAGCSYPPEYSAASLAPTAGACGAGLSQAVNGPMATPTAAARA